MFSYSSKTDINSNRLLDLYIDESGGASIGEPRYKFFLISAVLLTSEEKVLADLLFSKWRSKYLKDPSKCLHAADFFEDFAPQYAKNEVQMARNFRRSIDELIELLNLINFQAEVYYVNLHKLRKILFLNEPPAYQSEFEKTSDKRRYASQRREYEKIITDTVGEKKKFLPLSLTLKNAFTYHDLKIDEMREKLLDKTLIKGYLNFESLSGSDTMLISNFHKLKSKISTAYEAKIVGLNFHTKSSLGGGIELADLISYISFQTLRSSNHLKSELENISTESLNHIKRIRNFMRKKKMISLKDITATSL